MNDIEWYVDDPVIGEVSCDSREQAIDYAARVGGQVWYAVWCDGEVISQHELGS